MDKLKLADLRKLLTTNSPNCGGWVRINSTLTCKAIGNIPDTDVDKYGIINEKLWHQF